MKLIDVIKEMKDNEVMGFLKDQNLLAIVNRDDEFHHMRRLYLLKGDKVEELNVPALAEEMADYLKDKITTKKFFKDFVKTIPPHAFLELSERIKKKPKVWEKEGCYKLLVGGKKGRPFEMIISG